MLMDIDRLQVYLYHEVSICQDNVVVDNHYALASVH